MVNFGTDNDRTITWITRDELFEAPWKDLCVVLGYGEAGKEDPMGFRPHDRAQPSDKIVLALLYIRGRGIPGKSKYLQPVYDIMHCIYHSTFIPKVGTQDQIHGYLVDLMLATHTMKGKAVPLDVPDYLWNELYLYVINHKVPILCLYIMAFLNAKWAKHRPGMLLTSTDKCMSPRS